MVRKYIVISLAVAIGVSLLTSLSFVPKYFEHSEQGIIKIVSDMESQFVSTLQQTPISSAPLLPNYNITESKVFASLSALAFCSSQCINKWNCALSKDIKMAQPPKYIADNLTLTAGYIGYMPETKTIVASWRGSSNKRNWYQNFNFELVPYGRCKDCYLHAGFYFDYLLMADRIIATIDQLKEKYQVDRIITTGHSLGAAISAIMGIEMKLHYSGVVEIHNFGQPRIGNTNTAQYLNTKLLNRIFRVVHNRDIVPHVPFQFMYYTHSAHEIFFDQNMKNYVICDDSGEDKKCSNQFFPLYSTDDHDFYFINMGHSSAHCKQQQIAMELRKQ